MSETPDLAARSAAFAEDVQRLLDAVLPHDKRIISVEFAQRYVIRPEGEGAYSQRIPLFIDGERYADLSFSLHQELDRRNEHLKTSRTDFAVYSSLDRQPLVRMEYRADMRSDPVSHWQFHAERGAFTALLAMAHRHDRVSGPHDLSKVHMPTGGERFRPGIEDLLEFLVRECGVDAHPGWRQAVADGREAWRRRQLRAAVRDLQHEAAETLRSCGWEVSEPLAVSPDHIGPYRRW
ncbi:hypothetical protein IM660_17075 [Ruania alkalisoli]|uniref:Uncharacterized protein n=1 Tax=Ruania alkalisoli TaxID=2779775 RepID=A0A7M1SUJ8_9MICO|nr:hypothetical protein [Ruania alkalisoli]QOR70293.1 hypothetical protein IM660_17075 [Ruania alkalisoli]